MVDDRPGVAALYDRIAAGYHRWWGPVIEPAALRLLDIVAPVVTSRPEAILVDVGAGTGPLARAAVARWPGLRAIAVDPSLGMLELGRAEAARTLEPAALKRLRWQRGLAEALPLDDARADAVVSSFALQYIRNRNAALREAYRVLKPGGTLALVTWLVDDAPFAPYRLLRELLSELRIQRPPSAEAGPFRSLPSAAALVRRAGFRNVRAESAIVEYQWTLDAFLHCAQETEDVDLLDALDEATRRRLLRLWRARLERLSAAELRYRDRVASVSGRRPPRPRAHINNTIAAPPG